MPGAKAEGAQTGLACRGPMLPQRVMHGRACQPGAWDVGRNLALWVSQHLLGDHAIRGHSHTGSSHSVPRTGAWGSAHSSLGLWLKGKVSLV